jgi:hypothetical protein
MGIDCNPLRNGLETGTTNEIGPREDSQIAKNSAEGRKRTSIGAVIPNQLPDVSAEDFERRNLITAC